METLLSRSQKELQKLNAKYNRLRKQHLKATEEKRIAIDTKMDIVVHQLSKALFIYRLRAIEQACRDAISEVKYIPQLPGEVEAIIQALANTPKNKSINEEFRKAELNKEIIKVSVDFQVDNLKRAFDDFLEIFPDKDDDDDGDDENDDDHPEPKPIRPQSVLLSL